MCSFVYLFFRVGIFSAISIDHTELQIYVSVPWFDCLTFDVPLVLFSWIVDWTALQPDHSPRVFGYFFNNLSFHDFSNQNKWWTQVLIQILFYFSWEEHKLKEYLIRHNRQQSYLLFWMICSPVSSFVVAEKKEELKQRFITQDGNSPFREGQQKENIAIILLILRVMSSSILLWADDTKFSTKKYNTSTINKRRITDIVSGASCRNKSTFCYILMCYPRTLKQCTWEGIRWRNWFWKGSFSSSHFCNRLFWGSAHTVRKTAVLSSLSWDFLAMLLASASW